MRKPTEFFYFSPPLSEKARYIERIRRTGPDSMEIEFSIEDPETLTGLWQVKVPLERVPQVDRLVHDAFTNDRSELDGDFFAIMAPAGN